MAPKVEQQSRRNRDSYSTCEDITAKEVDEIPQNLRGNESDSESPSPRALAKATDRGECQRRSEQRKTDACDFPERDEFLMCTRIERPGAMRCAPEKNKVDAPRSAIVGPKIRKTANRVTPRGR